MEIRNSFDTFGSTHAVLTVADWELAAIGLDLLEVYRCVNLGRVYQGKGMPRAGVVTFAGWAANSHKAAPEPKHIYASKDEMVVVIIWDDGDKTIARCSEGDTPDVERGIWAATMRKLYGSRSRYRKLFGKVEVQGE